MVVWKLMHRDSTIMSCALFILILLPSLSSCDVLLSMGNIRTVSNNAVNGEGFGKQYEEDGNCDCIIMYTIRYPVSGPAGSGVGSRDSN